jgi:hypothetical protein
MHNGQKTANQESILINKQLINLNNSENIFKPTKKENWTEFVGHYWILPNKVFAQQSVSAFLFYNSTGEFFIDDLKIEIREF